LKTRESSLLLAGKVNVCAVFYKEEICNNVAIMFI